ncbi:MAG: recombinase family protein [Marinisporobacter sp.]|nr:recombinase family protein [Marinisporobacter sp.]
MNKLVKNPYKYAAIYARESNSKAKNAIDTQLYICKKYAFTKEFLIYDTYHEYISAAQVSYKSRSEFMRLIEDAKKGYFKKLIVTRRDRLTRQFEEFLEIKKIFKKLDVEIIYSNDVQMNEGKDYACNFIENILMGLAEMEAKRIKERSADGKRAKVLKGVYDKRPPYGIVYKKHEKKYYKDGVKGDIVKDIFNIYLNDKSVKESQDVIQFLHKRANKREEHKEQYDDLLKKVTKNKITDILSKPIYAGLYIKNPDIKYKDFYMSCDGKRLEVDEEYFQRYDNIIDTFITPKQWYETVKKWNQYNPIKKKSSKLKKREKVIFKDLFICDKCGKKLKYSNGRFSCGSDGCRGIGKDHLMRTIIIALVEYLVYENNIDDVIKDVVKKLNHEITKQKNKLAANINEQGKLIEKYIENAFVDKLKKQIVVMTKEQRAIKKEVNEIDQKINFLKGQLKEIIIPLVKSGYIHMITEELEKNQSAMFEIFMYENLKEMKIRGHSIRINYKE